jgi:hypothetical protein
MYNISSAWTEIMCLGTPCSSMALSKVLLIHPPSGPSSGVTDITLREKWSITTQTWMDRSVFINACQTQLGHKPSIKGALIGRVRYYCYFPVKGSFGASYFPPCANTGYTADGKQRLW